MHSCYSILECYNLFSGVELSTRSFYFIIVSLWLFEGSSEIQDQCLISNRTNAFHSIFEVSFVSDRCDMTLVFDISFLKIGQILTDLQELEDQNAINYETSELFHFGSYMGVQL